MKVYHIVLKRDNHGYHINREMILMKGRQVPITILGGTLLTLQVQLLITALTEESHYLHIHMNVHSHHFSVRMYVYCIYTNVYRVKTHEKEHTGSRTG